MPLYPASRPWGENPTNPIPKSGALNPGMDGDVDAASDPCEYTDADMGDDAD